MRSDSGASGAIVGSLPTRAHLASCTSRATCATNPALSQVRGHDLLAALGTATDFAGAACVGRWGLFDPRGDHESTDDLAERHEAASHVCTTCPLPTFARCAATARALPKAHRRGVWAGTSYDLPTPKGPGRWPLLDEAVTK